jgi:hypothetical protein
MFHPFFIFPRLAYLHDLNVVYSQQIVKGKSLFFGIFLGILPGAAALGYFPDKVNAGGVINSLFGHRLYSSPQKPLHNGRRPYTQNLGYLCDGQSFHAPSIEKNLKKVNSFNKQVLTKLVVYNYDIFIGDRTMKTVKLNSVGSVTGAIFWPAEEVETLFKKTRKSRDYEGFFKEMKHLWDLAEPTDYWPQNDSFETVVQREQMYLKIPG